MIMSYNRGYTPNPLSLRRLSPVTLRRNLTYRHSKQSTTSPIRALDIKSYHLRCILGLMLHIPHLGTPSLARDAGATTTTRPQPRTSTPDLFPRISSSITRMLLAPIFSSKRSTAQHAANPCRLLHRIMHMHVESHETQLDRVQADFRFGEPWMGSWRDLRGGDGWGFQRDGWGGWVMVEKHSGCMSRYHQHVEKLSYIVAGRDVVRPRDMGPSVRKRSSNDQAKKDIEYFSRSHYDLISAFASLWLFIPHGEQRGKAYHVRPAPA